MTSLPTARYVVVSSKGAEENAAAFRHELCSLALVHLLPSSMQTCSRHRGAQKGVGGLLTSRRTRAHANSKFVYENLLQEKRWERNHAPSELRLPRAPALQRGLVHATGRGICCCLGAVSRSRLLTRCREGGYEISTQRASSCASQANARAAMALAAPSRESFPSVLGCRRGFSRDACAGARESAGRRLQHQMYFLTTGL